MYVHAFRLEPQFSEEPFVFASLVFFFEFNTGLEAMCLTLNWVFKILHSHLVKWNIGYTVSCRHDVVVIQQLKLK